MAKHLIALIGPADSPQNQQVVKRIKDAYPGYYPVVDGRTYLVRTPDVVDVVASTLGLAGQEAQDPRQRATRLVLRISRGLSGCGPEPLVDWLTAEA